MSFFSDRKQQSYSFFANNNNGPGNIFSNRSPQPANNPLRPQTASNFNQGSFMNGDMNIGNQAGSFSASRNLAHLRDPKESFGCYSPCINGQGPFYNQTIIEIRIKDYEAFISNKIPEMFKPFLQNYVRNHHINQNIKLDFPSSSPINSKVVANNGANTAPWVGSPSFGINNGGVGNQSQSNVNGSFFPGGTFFNTPAKIGTNGPNVTSAFNRNGIAPGMPNPSFGAGGGTGNNQNGFGDSARSQSANANSGFGMKIDTNSFFNTSHSVNQNQNQGNQMKIGMNHHNTGHTSFFGQPSNNPNGIQNQSQSNFGSKSLTSSIPVNMNMPAPNTNGANLQIQPNQLMNIVVPSNQANPKQMTGANMTGTHFVPGYQNTPGNFPKNLGMGGVPMTFMNPSEIPMLPPRSNVFYLIPADPNHLSVALNSAEKKKEEQQQIPNAHDFQAEYESDEKMRFYREREHREEQRRKREADQLFRASRYSPYKINESEYPKPIHPAPLFNKTRTNLELLRRKNQIDKISSQKASRDQSINSRKAILNFKPFSKSNISHLGSSRPSSVVESQILRPLSSANNHRNNEPISNASVYLCGRPLTQQGQREKNENLNDSKGPSSSNGSQQHHNWSKLKKGNLSHGFEILESFVDATGCDFSFSPNLEELPKEKLKCVEDLVLENQFGRIFFPGETDVRGIVFRETVSIKELNIDIYIGDRNKPPVGFGLNRDFLLTFKRVKNNDKENVSEEVFIDYLKKQTEKIAKTGGFCDFDKDKEELTMRILEL